MNSFRTVEKAITFEIARQTDALAAGERIVQETRLWDADREETRSMRKKEYADDYRYFPEPDLLPLVVEPAWVTEVRSALPELPSARRDRFIRDHGLSPYDADVLTLRKDVADYFEAGVAAGAAPKEMANWVMTELLRIVREEKLDRALVIKEWPLTAAQLARLACLVQAGDRGAIERAVADVVARHPAQAAEFRAGKDRVVGFLVGQVMKATGGKANPQLVQELLRAALAG